MIIKIKDDYIEIPNYLDMQNEISQISTIVGAGFSPANPMHRDFRTWLKALPAPSQVLQTVADEKVRLTNAGPVFDFYYNKYSVLDFPYLHYDFSENDVGINSSSALDASLAGPTQVAILFTSSFISSVVDLRKTALESRDYLVYREFILQNRFKLAKSWSTSRINFCDFITKAGA